MRDAPRTSASGDRPLPLALDLGVRIAGSPRRLSDIARRKTTLAVLDTVGVALAGWREPAVTCLLVGAGLGAAPGPATLWGSGRRTVVLDAIQLNATAAHALDFDDCAPEALLHPSTVLVPVVLALSEQVGATGADALAAYAAGFETMMRIGLGLGPDHPARGWHPTSTIGAPAAAAAAAVLLDLDAGQTATALALSAAFASGLAASHGSMAKPIQCGQAARSGALAALLAASGADANDSALDGPGGYVGAFGGAGAAGVLAALDRWMDPPEIERAVLGPKLYPCCGSSHPAIEAALALGQQGLAAGEIEGITLSLAAERSAKIDRPRPKSALEAKFSLQYVVACALVRGGVFLSDFEDDAWDAADVRQVMDAISIERSAAKAMDFSTTVTVRLRDGTVRARTGTGGWRTPSDAEVWTKFEACAARCLPAEAIRAAHDALSRLPDAARAEDALAPLRAPFAAGRSRTGVHEETS